MMNHPNDHTIDFRYAPGRRWTCIGRPDDPFKTLVDEEGRLLYGFQREGARFGTYRFARVVSFGLHTDARPTAIRQRTESARFPLVITEIDYPHARLTLQAVGHQHDGHLRTDLLFWQIDPLPGHGTITSGLWLQIQGMGERFSPLGLAPSARIYPLPPSHAPRWQGLGDLFVQHPDPEPQDPQTAPALFLYATPHPLQVASAFDHGPASGLRTDFAPISPGQPYAGALLFPQNHAGHEGWDAEWARAALIHERRFWQGVDWMPATRLQIPDEGVMDMVMAAARNLIQAREVKDGIAEFQVGPTIYRGFWVIDGYFFLEAAQFMGREADALRGIDALLRRVRPNGAIEERSLDTKDTGLALATLVRQCELAQDMERLATLWPILRRAVGYVQALHEQAQTLPPEDPAHGLLPPSFGNGGLGGIRAEYTTALWMLVGVQSVVRAAHRLGYAQEATELQGFYDALFAAFRAHAGRDAVQLPTGESFLPMLKPGSGEHHWIHDFPETPSPWEAVNLGTATWAMAHAIYPGEILLPEDPLVQGFCAMLDALDDRQGIPEATGWLPYEAVWTYSASFYAHVWLYVGRPDKAVDYLYAFANHASPTRVWREEQSLKQSGLGQQIGDMPHNWASAEFIRLARNLLVFECGQGLRLLPALPAAWLIPGKTLAIQTPTAYGTVEITLTVDEAGTGDLVIQLQPHPHKPATTLPSPAFVELTLPSAPHFTLKRILFNGTPQPWSPDTRTLPLM